MSGAVPIWEGSEVLRDQLVPISSLTRHPENPRIGNVEEIAKGLRRYGQVRPVLVDEATGYVIAGNHRVLAASALGWTHIAIVKKQFRDADEARSYLLADNRLSDLGEYDKAELMLLIGELEESGVWAGTGYVQEDLDHLRALEAALSEPPPPPVAAPPPVQSPGLRERVLLLTEEQYADFGQHVKTLRGRYGLEGFTETIFRAVQLEALAANQGVSS